MHLFRVGGDTFLKNGRSVVRLGHVLTFPSPLSPSTRTVRVFEVLEVTRQSPTNPIQRGMMLALSFPNEKVNRGVYEWARGEESQVPMEVTDRKANLEAARRRN